MARREIWKRRREELNRRSRESRVARADFVADGEIPGLIIEEFLETLTPREREFCLAYLMKQPRYQASPGVSAANEWKLRSRVLKKFRLRFFHND